MGNSQKAKGQAMTADIIKYSEESVEDNKLSESIEVSEMPNNTIDTHNKLNEDSFSEHSSNQQSSDLGNCFKNGNFIGDISSKFLFDVEKNATVLRKDVLNSIYYGIVDGAMEGIEIPEDCSDSEM